MATKTLQPSFSRGELAPGLRARVDLASYGTGVAQARNVIVLADGGLQTRPGYQYLGNAKMRGSRLLPFIVSDEIAYVVELGDRYARFWFNGAPVESSPGVPLELVTGWLGKDLWRVRYTQSADVMYLACRGYQPQRIVRTGPSTFTVGAYKFREGPFRVTNANQTQKMAASGKTGSVTISANFSAFTPEMVGMLIKLEVPALGKYKPWMQGDRGVTVGALRRSDGKVYRARSLTPGGTSWTESGNIRPTHDKGIEWDGPATTRTDGTFTWGIGVEWEYLHSGYGIAQVSSYVSPTAVIAQVQVPFPDELIGGAGGAVNTWNFVGNGVTTVFNIPGATEPAQEGYQVTLNGEPV